MTAAATQIRQIDKQQLTFRDFWAARNAAFSFPWTNQVNHPVGAVLAYVFYRMHVSPNFVTLLSFSVSLVGACLFAVLPTSLQSAVIVAIVLQLGYSLDCVDGQLARATRCTSRLGAVLDVVVDCGATIAHSTALAWYGSHCAPQFSAEFTICAAILMYGRVMSLYLYTQQKAVHRLGSHEVPYFQQLYRLFADTGTLLMLTTLCRVNVALLLGATIIYSILFLIRSIVVIAALGKE